MKRKLSVYEESNSFWRHWFELGSIAIQRFTRITVFAAVVFGCKDSGTSNYADEKWKLVWTAQANYFHGLSFVDQNNGWVVGDSGIIFRTRDGGSSWMVQQSGIGVSLKCIVFADTSKGWIGGANNSIGLTTDGGNTWTWKHAAGESLKTFIAISFVNGTKGWIGDNFGEILHTDDGGITWTLQNSGVTTGIRSIHFLDAQEGWATATSRVVLHTTNGGNDWTKSTLDTVPYGKNVTVVFEEVYFVNRFNGWIATTSALSDTGFHPTPILATSDAGMTWKTQLTPENDFVNSVKFANTSEGWAAGSNGILHTSDGGGNWTFQLQAPRALFVDFCLVDESHCWALTFRGDVYRYFTATSL